MAEHQNVVVYIRAKDARRIKATGKEPAEWVRGVVKSALERMAAEQRG